MATGSVPDASEARGTLQRIVSTLSSYPGVEGAGIGPAPLTAGRSREIAEGADMIWFTQLGAEARRLGAPHRLDKFVDVGYLTTFRIPILFGRNFRAADNDSTPAVAILNATAARLLFPHTSAIDQHLKRTPSRLSGGRELAIVGVAGDSRQRDVRLEPEPEILVPIAQQSSVPPSATLSARTAGNVNELLTAFRRVISGVNADLPIQRLATMSGIIDESLLPQRFLLTLLVIFAVLAVSIASIGLYAIVAYLAMQQTREFGVRMAMGATSSDVLKLVAREGVAMLLVGTAIGIGVAYALSRLATSMLFGITATDLFAYVAATIVFAAVALVASLLPASKAARLDPTLALRNE